MGCQIRRSSRFQYIAVLLAFSLVALGDADSGPGNPPHEPLAANAIPATEPTPASVIESASDVNVNDLSAQAGSPEGVDSLYFPAWQGAEQERRRVYYLGGANFIFGCVRFPDTVTSGGYYYPNAFLQSIIPYQKRSKDQDSRFYDLSGVGDIEIYGVSSDTVEGIWSSDELSGQYLETAGIELHQTIRGWKKSYLARCLIVDDWVVNVSDHPIERACAGVAFWPPSVYCDQLWRICTDAGDSMPSQVSLCGLVRAVPGIVSGMADTINLAWVSENDGHAVCTHGVFGSMSPTAVLGIRILRAPKGGRFSFNWSISNWGWGPRRREALAGYSKDGAWPTNDRSLYQMMINGEIDYDQVYSAIDMSGQGWLPPLKDWAYAIAKGSSPSDIMLSVGPFDDWIQPGDSVLFSYAVVVGQDFHTDPRNFVDNFDYNDPSRYVNNLNFTDLITAAQWAGWFYDNPGVDTDGDGYKGEYVTTDCHGGWCDTVYYTGDGVPDYKGPEPPPPPPFEVTTRPTTITIHWTGALTEYARDKHSRRPDWEGYRVWLAQDDTSRGFTMLAGWDREDYVRYSYRPNFEDWKQSSGPLTVEEWQVELNDPGFDPNRYALPSTTNGYADVAVDTVRTPDGRIIGITQTSRLSYFGFQDANFGNSYLDEGHPTQNLIQRVGTVDTVIDGQLRQYGVYELTMDNLSQSQAYWIAVTAIDYGDYRNHIDPEENKPGDNSQYFRALYSADVVVDSHLAVSVFPNPYKLLYRDWDGRMTSYHEQGYEISSGEKFDERDRRIWFINLPEKALVQIYSLDGDLIREIRHPDAFLSHYNSAVGWDLISRNTQAVTSGIYIWKVTSELGTQMGKLIIIK